jgi:hypothetical protein
MVTSGILLPGQVDGEGITFDVCARCRIGFSERPVTDRFLRANLHGETRELRAFISFSLVGNARPGLCPRCSGELTRKLGDKISETPCKYYAAEKESK